MDLINNANINPYLNTSRVFVCKDVDTNFANNVIRQYQNLCQFSSGEKAKKLIILKDIKDVEKIKEEYQALAQYLEGDASIAYGIYSKKDDAICIIQDNHKRKEEKYEGNIAEQGADTLTHEFAHLLDDGLSQTSHFENAFLEDLKELEKNLTQNPYAKIGKSDMSYLDAKEYFKHYIEGVDFTDGISSKDITKRGARENFAESYSTIFDENPSEVNGIYASIFSNSINATRALI
ncbi:MAG: hypothetical protein IKL52_01095 [Candidatus Gastranaerophilales bacterium]|nr:hypothetical protein [Candidatus Gastranaerophilales bacterium]